MLFVDSAVGQFWTQLAMTIAMKYIQTLSLTQLLCTFMIEANPALHLNDRH